MVNYSFLSRSGFIFLCLMMSSIAHSQGTPFSPIISNTESSIVVGEELVLNFAPLPSNYDNVFNDMQIEAKEPDGVQFELAATIPPDSTTYTYRMSKTGNYEFRMRYSATLVFPPITVYTEYSNIFSILSEAEGPSAGQILSLNNGAINDRFGYDITTFNGVSIIGAPNLKNSIHAYEPPITESLAYVYEKNSNGQWSQKQTLRGEMTDNSYGFGYSVDMHGNDAIIGDRNGYSYIFKKQSNGEWVQTQALSNHHEDINDSHLPGDFVAIQGDWAFTGHANDKEVRYRGGAVYIYKRNASGVWEKTQKLIASDVGSTGALSDDFGLAVDVSGDYLFVKSQTGYYVFHRTSEDLWIETQKISVVDRNSSRERDDTVKVLGDTAVIGYSDINANASNPDGGSVLIYKLNTATQQWEQIQQIFASDSSGNFVWDRGFGLRIALSENSLVVGSSFVVGSHKDKVYLFKKSASGIWQQSELLGANGVEIGSGVVSYGHALSISGSDIFISDDSFFKRGEEYLAPKIFLYNNL